MDGSETNGANEDTMLIDTDPNNSVLHDTLVVVRPPPSPSPSSSLTTARSTPSLLMFDPTNYPAGIYDDTVPSDSKFYVSIKPMDADFIREDYVIDEDEFTIVSIIGEIGEGDDITYEVQFVDDHITMVCLSFPISSDDSNDSFSYLSANCFVIKMQKRRSRNIKLGAKVADDHEDNEKKQNHFKDYPTLMQVIWIRHLMNALINDEELLFEDHLKEHAQIQEDQKLDQPGPEDSSV